MSKKFSLFLIVCVGFYLAFIHRSRELPLSVVKEGVSVIDEIVDVSLSDFRPYNPGVIFLGDRYLLVTRAKASNLWQYLKLKLQGKRRNVIMVTELDENFAQVEKMVQLLPQKEDGMTKVTDPRLFWHNGEIYMIFCDHTHGGSVQTLAKLQKKEGVWEATNILPLFYEYCFSNYVEKGIEKNWMPFSKEGKLYVVYLLEPENVVLEVNLEKGNCILVSKTENGLLNKFSPLRGGTPPVFDEELGEYLTLYHIAFAGRNSFTTLKKNIYICGAATFTKNAPFILTGRTMTPFYQKNLYNNREKIVFPTALLRKGDDYLMFYGEDDCRIKVAKINRAKLIAHMQRREDEKGK